MISFSCATRPCSFFDDHLVFGVHHHARAPISTDVTFVSVDISDPTYALRLLAGRPPKLIRSGGRVQPCTHYRPSRFNHNFCVFHGLSSRSGCTKVSTHESSGGCLFNRVRIYTSHHIFYDLRMQTQFSEMKMYLDHLLQVQTPEGRIWLSVARPFYSLGDPLRDIHRILRAGLLP